MDPTPHFPAEQCLMLNDVARIIVSRRNLFDLIIYIPLEAAQPHTDWAGVEEYYKNVAAFVEWVKAMRVSDLSVDVFGDVAYAFCNFHDEVGFKGQSQPLILDARDTFILRRKGGAWKVIHYHESRPHLSTR